MQVSVVLLQSRKNDATTSTCCTSGCSTGLLMHMWSNEFAHAPPTGYTCCPPSRSQTPTQKDI